MKFLRVGLGQKYGLYIHKTKLFKLVEMEEDIMCEYITYSMAIIISLVESSH